MKLNLGCGIHTMSGWTNIDVDFGPANNDHHKIRHNLAGSLPDFIATESVDFIFTEHFIEHITREQAVMLLRDCHRVLKKGGILRISTPDLGRVIDHYRLNNVAAMPGVWMPKNKCAMVNEGMRLWGHQWLYDREDMKAVLTEAGFSVTKLTFCHKRVSIHPELQNLEVRPENFEMYLEIPRKLKNRPTGLNYLKSSLHEL